jgi:hypothetical protein
MVASLPSAALIQRRALIRPSPTYLAINDSAAFPLAALVATAAYSASPPLVSPERLPRVAQYKLTVMFSKKDCLSSPSLL